MKTNSFSKNSVATLLALVMISGAALQPKRSDAAIVSLITGGAPEAALSALMALGVVGMGTAFFFGDDSKVGATALTVGAYSVFFGLMLDDSGQQKIVLKSIDNKLASQAGITAEEQESYNHELDIIQATLDDISAQVAPLKKSERKVAAHRLWNDYRSVMSPASFSALKKVTAQMAQ